MLKLTKINFKIALNLKFYLYFKNVIKAINSFYFIIKVIRTKKKHKA